MNASIEMELMVAGALRGMQPPLGVPVLEGRAKTTRPATYIAVNAAEEEYLVNQLMKVTVEILHVSQMDDSLTETARGAAAHLRIFCRREQRVVGHSGGRDAPDVQLAALRVFW
jgi:hypothetical protein